MSGQENNEESDGNFATPETLGDGDWASAPSGVTTDIGSIWTAGATISGMSPPLSDPSDWREI